MDKAELMARLGEINALKKALDERQRELMNAIRDAEQDEWSDKHGLWVGDKLIVTPALQVELTARGWTPQELAAWHVGRELSITWIDHLSESVGAADSDNIPTYLTLTLAGEMRQAWVDKQEKEGGR